MKSAIAVLAASLVFAIAGCAAGDANMSTVEYPPPPVGYDAPPQTPPEGVAASEPAGAGRPQLVSAEGTDQQFAPQQGDTAIGVDSDEGYSDTDPAALSDFRQPLEPYGTWADDAQYGTVWTPSASAVGTDFAPYVTAGHWTYDNDYTWVSDYEWGWAPYHYGRWVYIGNGNRGWSWIPGRQYAGAWVTWRTGSADWGYVGWAPMPPTWYWRGGYAVGIGFVPMAPYVFCSNGYLFDRGVGGRIVTGAQVGVIASHTRPYVASAPAAGGHVLANPGIGGPAPHTLGLSAGAVAHAPVDNRGLQHAQQFAHPNSAQALGARAPQHSAQAANTPMQSSHSFSAPQQRLSQTTTLGRNAPVASSPQYHGVQPTPYRAPSYSQSYSSPYSHGSASAPAYGGHASSSYSSAPAFHSAPSSAPAYHSPAPSYHSSAPSVSHSSGGGGFHGGGGSHGGGGRR